MTNIDYSFLFEYFEKEVARLMMKLIKIYKKMQKVCEIIVVYIVVGVYIEARQF